MEVTETIESVRALVRTARDEGKKIGFVPTMGALHIGHISLIEVAVADCDFVVVSIFVNPAQFGENEDLDNYPRDYQRDKSLLEEKGTDLIFYPNHETMYPEQFSTWIIEDHCSKSLCGKTRSRHFRGVLTIVAKLFNLVQPNNAYFGQKDYQQAVLIKKMVSELNFPLEIVICPIARESDGLAMSSRNNYLGEDERTDALVLSKTLNHISHLFTDGENAVEKLVSEGKKYFTDNCGKASLEYLEILDGETLSEINSVKHRSAALIAGNSGATRLIDNW